MSKRVLTALLVASLLASFLGAGCYTVLQHPRSQDLVNEESGTRRECYDCHAGADAAHFQDPFNVYYYDYYPQRWYPYYARPWWYSDYWYNDQPSGETQPVETGGRHAWTRPPAGRGDAPPAVAPLPPAPVTGGAKDEPKPAEQKQEKEKEGRHAWVRGSSKGGR
jgi:hypothetical protein